jgi:hypothetical protein
MRQLQELQELQELLAERERLGPGVLRWTVAALVAGPPRLRAPGEGEVMTREEAILVRQLQEFREARSKAKRQARDRARRARQLQEVRQARREQAKRNQANAMRRMAAKKPGS